MWVSESSCVFISVDVWPCSTLSTIAQYCQDGLKPLINQKWEGLQHVEDSRMGNVVYSRDPWAINLLQDIAGMSRMILVLQN